MGENPSIETQSFIVAPDPYPMTDNHFLVICKRHINSMAELNSEENNELALINYCINALLNKHVIRSHKFFDIWSLEHGSGQINQENSASTIKHAHLHIVPVKTNAWTWLHPDFYLYERLDKMSMPGIWYKDNAEKRLVLPQISVKPYLYLGKNEVWPEGAFYQNIESTNNESQFFRKIIEERSGGCGFFNWKVASDEVKLAFLQRAERTAKSFETYMRAAMGLDPENYLGQDLQYDERFMNFISREDVCIPSINDPRKIDNEIIIA